MYMSECMILVSVASHIYFCFWWKEQEVVRTIFFPSLFYHWENKLQLAHKTSMILSLVPRPINEQPGYEAGMILRKIVDQFVYLHQPKVCTPSLQDWLFQASRKHQLELGMLL